MGLPNNHPDKFEAEDPRSAEAVLQTVTQDLKALQSDLVTQLTQEVRRLQTEKNRLLNEIEKLQDQQEMLQSQQSHLLSQQQLAQQQVWAKQLAQAMAAHLYTLLTQRLSQSGIQPPLQRGANLPGTANGYGEDTERLIGSLDSALNQTLNSLRQDLVSYQTTLSQQLNRMHSLEQQGEAILDALVSRLSQRLQQESAQPLSGERSTGREREMPLEPPYQPPMSSPVGASRPMPPRIPPTSGTTVRGSDENQVFPPGNRPTPPQPPPPSLTPSTSSFRGQFWLGLGLGLIVGLVVLYALAQLVGGAIARASAFPPSPVGWWVVLLLAALALFLVFSRYRATARMRGAHPIMVTAPEIAPEPMTTTVRSPARPLNLSQFQLGLGFILLSTIALSLHNVVVGIVYYRADLFGRVPIGEFIPVSFGNSLLILWMRMLIVVPTMAFLASILYPPAWRDIRAFSLSKDRPLLVTVVGSGFFLFLSQVLIYIAIGQVGPGVAVTILFMYPIVTVPLAWFLFGDRPTSMRLGVMGAILGGVLLTAAPKLISPGATGNVPLGTMTAVVSGIAFAFYLISMQISFRKLHPVPVSLIQFVTIFFLASLSLIFLPLNPVVPAETRTAFMICGLILGVLTLVGYLLNNFGVRFMGAAMASILASSGPVLTALLAFLITPAPRTALQPIQILGILTVTLGVAALSFEKLLLQRRQAAKATR